MHVKIPYTKGRSGYGAISKDEDVEESKREETKETEPFVLEATPVGLNCQRRFTTVIAVLQIVFATLVIGFFIGVFCIATKEEEPDTPDTR